jgi:ubiquinol-cytochrome c reductase cytochrome b subunit
LKRFFLFHFQFPFLVCGFWILHLFYLHFLSSNNPLRNSTNNKIPFFPFIFQKDFFGFILILCLYLLQTHFGISSFSHPDNALEVCGLLTPLHIVPEWYFLCQYAILIWRCKEMTANKEMSMEDWLLLESFLEVYSFPDLIFISKE